MYIPTRYAMLIEGEAVGLVLESLLTKRDALRLSLRVNNCRMCRRGGKERNGTVCCKPERRQRRCEEKEFSRRV